jgi:GTPase SAR1 family protein
MSVLTGKTQRDLYNSSMHALDLLAHHHKRSSKRRSRTSQFGPAPKDTVTSVHTFHMPTSSFSNSHGPYLSALSSAFSPGVDAVILIFDVDQPETETLRALDRQWSEFGACAPLGDEETEGYCLVVVGNKTDLVFSSEGRLRRDCLGLY